MFLLPIYIKYTIITEGSQNHAIKLTVEPIGPTTIYVEWRLAPEYVNSCKSYSLIYTTQATNEIRSTKENSLTLTDLTECTPYTFTVQCSYEIDENTFGQLASTATIVTSHAFRE